MKRFDRGDFDEPFKKLFNKYIEPLMISFGDQLIDNLFAKIKMSKLGQISGASRRAKKENKALARAMLENTSTIGSIVAESDLPGVEDPRVAKIIAPFLMGIESKAMNKVDKFIETLEEKGIITTKSIICNDGETTQVPEMLSEVSEEKQI